MSIVPLSVWLLTYLSISLSGCVCLYVCVCPRRIVRGDTTYPHELPMLHVIRINIVDYLPICLCIYLAVYLYIGGGMSDFHFRR